MVSTPKPSVISTADANEWADDGDDESGDSDGRQMDGASSGVMIATRRDPKRKRWRRKLSFIDHLAEIKKVLPPGCGGMRR